MYLLKNKKDTIQLAEDAKVFDDMAIKAIKALTNVIKKFDGKVINNHLKKAIDKEFQNQGISFVSHLGSSNLTTQYEDGHVVLTLYPTSGLNLSYGCQPWMNARLFKVDENKRLIADKVINEELPAWEAHIEHHKAKYQDAADNYDTYEKMVNEIDSLIDNFNRKRNSIICPNASMIR